MTVSFSMKSDNFCFSVRDPFQRALLSFPCAFYWPLEKPNFIWRQSSFQRASCEEMIHINICQVNIAEKHPFHITVCILEWMGSCEQFCTAQGHLPSLEGWFHSVTAKYHKARETATMASQLSNMLSKKNPTLSFQPRLLYLLFSSAACSQATSVPM